MWKDIPDFPDYAVSDDGEVLSKRRNRLLSPAIDRYGYQKVTLCKNGRNHYFTVHRLVAMVFVPNTKGGNQVNHIDENKMNNKASNLEWVTAYENDNHGTRNSRMSNTKCKRPIIHTDGTFEYYYKGVKHASRMTGIAHSQITRFCNDKTNTKWRYADEQC